VQVTLEYFVESVVNGNELASGGDAFVYKPITLRLSMISLRNLSVSCCVSALLAIAPLAGTARAGTISGSIYYGIASTDPTNPQGQGYATSGVTVDTLANAIATSSGFGATFTATSVNFTTGPGQGPTRC
jgi:hypothetical protein